MTAAWAAPCHERRRTTATSVAVGAGSAFVAAMRNKQIDAGPTIKGHTIDLATTYTNYFVNKAE